MLDVETLGAALKLAKKGGGGGGEGGSGAVIDDSKISSSTTWSSQKIVDTLCPPFTVSGAIVQCTPVANYPLSVQASWEPRQEGTGDPSPENIRPIVGLDSVQVTRCGKNVLDTSGAYRNGYNYVLPNARLIAGAKYTYTASSLIASGEAAGLFVIADDYKLVDYIGSGESYTFTVPENLDFSQGLWIGGGSASALDNVPAESFMVELGTTPTSYEPYQPGTTATLTLPETIYGGELDAVTGEGVETVHGIVLDGTELWSEDNSGSTGLEYFYYAVFDGQWLPSSGGSLALAKSSQKISHFAIGNPYSENVDNAGWVYSTGSADHYGIRIRMSTCADVDEWKSYLAAQAAAGTPVTIAYKLATPTAFQATGGQSLPALPGTNTIYTDADTVTVSGLSDTVETFNALENRIAALEEAAISG